MFTGCKFGAVHAKTFVYTAIVAKGETGTYKDIT